MNQGGSQPGGRMAGQSGSLFLIPTPLGALADPLQHLPPATIEAALKLDYFVAENARTARAFLGRLPLRRPLQAIEIRELSEHTSTDQLPALLAPVLAGRDAGLVSEAGCPGVADPGAALVALAHRHGVAVHPLIGPGSLLLALMASGLQGQRFAFAGYLPVPAPERTNALLALQRRSAQHDETQLMIETPYRVQALYDECLRTLAPETQLLVARSITLPGESIVSRRIEDWRRAPARFERDLVVFGLLAARVNAASASRPSRARTSR